MAVLLAAAALVSSPLTGDADAAPRTINHASLVPQTPETGYPIIELDRVLEGRGPYTNVYAVDQIGDLIVSGGDFRRIKLQNGQTIAQTSFAAWGVEDKQLRCPAQFTFDDTVYAVEKAPWPNHVYVGGKFRTITDSTGTTYARQKMALLDLNDCTVDPIFDIVASNNRLQSIEFEHGRLFVAGGFTSIAGHDSVLVAELDPFTGKAVKAFQATGTINPSFGMSRALEINDAGDRLVFLARYVTSLSMGGTTINNSASFVFDISDPEAPKLTNHSWPFFTGWGQMHGGGISDDGTKIAASYHMGVHFIDVVESPQTTKWTHWNGDGTFDAAVSNNAVYASGHFCRTQPGPGPTDNMGPVGGHTRCSLGGQTYRTQFVAYSLVDGTPLTWNPGNTAQVGGKAITITPRGLLFGMDGMSVAEVWTGQVAFLDFGPQADPNPDRVATCTAEQIGIDVRMTWSVDHVTDVQLRSAEDGWLMNGTGGEQLFESTTVDEGYGIRYRYASRSIDLPCDIVGEAPVPSCTATQDGINVRIDWTAPFNSSVGIRDAAGWVGDSDNGTFLAENASIDDGFSIRVRVGEGHLDYACERLGVAPPTPSCTATQAASDVRIDWIAPFAESVTIRDAGGWVATSTNGSHIERNASVDAGWTMRYRENGANVDSPCTTVGTPPAPPSCVATQVDRNVRIDWVAPLADIVTVRNANGWVIDSTDGTHLQTEASVADGWNIRYRQGGDNIDVPCTTVGAPPPPPACTAVAEGDGARVSWTDVAAQNISVRQNDAWVASVDNGDTTVLVPGVAVEGLSIRFNAGGGRVDVACN